jgi:hypothetical protein
MRIFLIVVALLVVAAGVGIAMFPLSVVASMLAERAGGFSYASATGTIWDGKLTQASFRGQDLGDVSFKIDALAVFTGKLAAKVGLSTTELAGDGAFSYGLFDKKAELHDVNLTGKTTRIPGLPQQLKTIDGDFRVQLARVNLSGNGCAEGVGTVWTNLLAKGAAQLGWPGPEMSGPITCHDGRLNATVAGAAATGDRAEAVVDVGVDLTGSARAVVIPAAQVDPSRMARYGFQPVGQGRYEMTMRLGRGAGT